MLETRTFSENPFKFFKIVSLSAGGLVLFTTLVSLLVEVPRITGDGLNKSATVIGSLLAISGVVMLTAFVICSITSKKTLKCDFNGCEVLRANFCLWQSPRHLSEFKWSDVTDTNIIEEIKEDSDGMPISHYTFVVQTKGEIFDLMELKNSSKKNIEELINYVNQAAPQTKHIWVTDEGAANRSVIESHYGYSKIARNN